MPTTDGVAVYLRSLLAGSSAGSFRVTPACPGEGPLAGWAHEAGAAWIELPLTRQPDLRDARWMGRLRPLLSSTDVVCLHSSKAGAVGRLALLTIGGRRPGCVYVPHGWSWLAGGRLTSADRTFERLAAPLADVIVAVSEGERQLGAQVIGAEAQRLRVIPTGVDTERFAPASPAAHHDITSPPLIVCIGRLCRAKGQDIAVRAFAAMRCRDARLRLIGDDPGAGSQSLISLAAELGVASRVELMPAVEDPVPHLRAADIVVVPSRWDGQSLVLLEAMACAAAVVATDVPGSTVLTGAGLVVPAHDPPAMARAMDDLAASPGLRVSLGIAARRRVVGRFGQPLWRDRFEVLFSALATGAAGARVEAQRSMTWSASR